MNALGAFGALAFGAAASAHCLLMCGGINAALALSTQASTPAHRWRLLLGYQAGRILSYAVAGGTLGGIGALLFGAVDRAGAAGVLRPLGAVVLAIVGITMLRGRGGIDLALGRRLWPRLSQAARRFFPVRRVTQALAAGAVWGFTPCGLVYSMLLIAWLQGDAWHSATTMLLFGLGTLPAVLAGALGAHRLRAWLALRGLRPALGGALIGCALLTLLGPWLVQHGLPDVAMHWLPADCTAHAPARS